MGDENNRYNEKLRERWWIKGWLDSFATTHGSEKANEVLGKDYAITGGKLITKRT